jgi:hypothetical protein
MHRCSFLVRKRRGDVRRGIGTYGFSLPTHARGPGAASGGDWAKTYLGTAVNFTVRRKSRRVLLFPAGAMVDR